MRKFAIKSWKDHQHYSDRNPPWIKLHRKLLTSSTWVKADDANRALAVALMLLAPQFENEIPADPELIQRLAYLNKSPNFEFLLKENFLEYIDSDTQNTDTYPVADCNQTVSSAIKLLASDKPSKSGQIAEVIAEWNQFAKENGFAISFGKGKIPDLIRARMKDSEWRGRFTAALPRILESEFHSGKNDRGWKANLEWLLRDGKVEEMATAVFGKPSGKPDNILRETNRDKGPEFWAKGAGKIL